MADRQRRKGIQHDFPHDPRNTRKPLATSAPSTDRNEEATPFYSASFDDTYHNQHQRGRSSVGCNRGNFPSSHNLNLRNFEAIRIRDSGYNTDVSPARTSSSTSTPADNNFSFDYPERMTIREDPTIGSPYSDSCYMPEAPPEHDHDQHQQQQHSIRTGTQFLQPSSHRKSSLLPILSTSGKPISKSFPTQPHLPDFSDARYSPRRNNNPDDRRENDGGLAFAQQEKHNQRPTVMSRSAPGSHACSNDVSVGGIGPSSSVPEKLCPEMDEQVSDDDLDVVDGRRGFASFSHGLKNSSSHGDELGIPLLPKSMSNSFQDFRGGEESESDEEDENDVMTSSEEREMEEMLMTSKPRRFSLRKRHYSGQDEDECGSSSPIPNIAHRFSGRSSDSSPVGSALSVHVPFSTSSPSFARGFIDAASPELASSIKTACESMIGQSIGSFTPHYEEEDTPSLGLGMGIGAVGSNYSIGAYLREEEEFVFEDVLEDTVDNFDMDDGDEDVFTFDLDDIQEYQKSQESTDKVLGAHRLHSQQHNTGIDYRSNDNQNRRPRHHQHSTPTTPKAPAAVPSRVVLDRPPISPSSRTGRKNVSKTVVARQGRAIHAHVQLAGGARLLWDEGPGFGGIVPSSPIQNPHRTNPKGDKTDNAQATPPRSEARGATFLHSRRGSMDVTAILRSQHAPLPDNMAPFSRGRALSAPNLHDVILRQKAQKTGRELRRLSDLFHENVVRRNSLQHDDNHGQQQSSSYPRMGPSSIFREGVRALSLISGTFRSRRDSSVDDDSFQEMANDEDEESADL